MTRFETIRRVLVNDRIAQLGGNSAAEHFQKIGSADTVVRTLARAIDDALGNEPADGWQPKETASFNLPVLVWRGEGKPRVQGMRIGERWYIRHGDDWKYAPDVTKWHYLPAAPKEDS
jgi:hypothetical protein